MATGGQTRREKIEQMLQADPGDVFLRYSLSMELSKERQLPAALQILEVLCSETPPYVPAFFRSAQWLAEEGQTEQARTFLRDGIDAAREQGDHHAAAEMSEMLADLGGGM